MIELIKLENLEFHFNFDNTGTDAITFEIKGIEFLEWVTKAGYVESQDAHLTICQSEALESLEVDSECLDVIRALLQDYLRTHRDARSAIQYHVENPATHINFNAEY